MLVRLTTAVIITPRLGARSLPVLLISHVGINGVNPPKTAPPML